MTLIEEEEIAVIVKKTLADALPISNTPGPVDVTGEGGFAALSLLYLDARGDLFIKEQQNQPLVWDGTDITIGPTNSEHITISPSAIDFKDGDDVLTSITPGAITVGETGTGKINTYITSSSFSVRDDTTKMLELTVAGTNQIIQIGTTSGSQQAWQFLKLNNDRDLSLRPSAATTGETTFKVIDYATSWKGFRVYHQDDVSDPAEETTFLSSNVGHISIGDESELNRLISGGHISQVEDGAATNLFKVTIAANQFFYGVLTIISWQDATHGAATTDAIRKYNVFVGYRGSSYPASNPKFVLLSDFNMGDAGVLDTLAIAEAGNDFTFSIERDLTADTVFPLAYTIEATTSSDVTTFVNLLN